MAGFTVRVELHSASEADYQLLHQAMELRGFSRTIRGDDGKTYHLLPGEYRINGNYTSTIIRQAATDAANNTGRTNAVFVTAGSDCAWQGLPIV